MLRNIYEVKQRLKPSFKFQIINQQINKNENNVKNKNNVKNEVNETIKINEITKKTSQTFLFI